MTKTSSFFDLTSRRRGHFQLESGHHSELWFDLDALFSEPARIDPFVIQLSDALRPYNVEGVCGPLLGGAFLAQLVAAKLGVAFFFTERFMPLNSIASSGMYQADYRLPQAFQSRVRDRRIAIVDDVMSAGSALRGTCNELQANGAKTLAAGALMVLGETGATFFAERQIPVEAVVRENYKIWLAADCPHCANRTPLEDVAGTGVTPG